MNYNNGDICKGEWVNDIFKVDNTTNSIKLVGATSIDTPYIEIINTNDFA